MKHEEISLITKKSLAQALKQAMKSKPFQKITVSELIQACNVNRKTFYYHFEDIYALLKWMFEQEAIEVVKKFDLMVDYDEMIAFILDYVEENDYIINCAYDSIGREELKRFFCSDFMECVDSMIRRGEEVTGLKLEDGYRGFLCRFYTDAVAGMLIEWIKSRDRYDRDTVIDYVKYTIRESLVGIFRSERREASGIPKFKLV